MKENTYLDVKLMELNVRGSWALIKGLTSQKNPLVWSDSSFSKYTELKKNTLPKTGT